MTTVLIVGAGPVGLTMAAELARYGVAVRIIDRAASATETSKALVIWSRTLELMDRAGCTPAFLETGLKATGASLRNGATVLGSARFAAIASPYNFALMIPQKDTERLLTAHLKGFGIGIERSVELTAFTQGSQSIQAHLRHPDGREEIVEVPWLIGCDGAHSAVRHGLGIEFTGEARREDWIIADVRLEGDRAPPKDEVCVYFHKDGPFVVFPMPGERSRVIASKGIVAPSADENPPTIEEVQRVADQRAGAGIRVLDPIWLSNFRINERKAAEYRHNRVFLAGDAAHIHSPAGGQGMNTGMQDAFNLARKLALAVQSSVNDILLTSYSTERSAVGVLVLRNATRLTDMATLSHASSQALRNAALRLLLSFHGVQDRLAATMSETDIAYADSPLSAGPRAGERLEPHLYDGAPPGSGESPRFTLYAADRNRAEAFTREYAGLMEARTREPFDAHRLCIVRPDGYVGLVADQDDWNAAESYLNKITNRAQ